MGGLGESSTECKGKKEMERKTRRRRRGRRLDETEKTEKLKANRNRQIGNESQEEYQLMFDWKAGRIESPAFSTHKHRSI